MRSVRRRLALALLATTGCLFVAAPVAAAPPFSDIAVDANTTSSGSSVTSLTWSHTVANKSNRLLVVRVAISQTKTVSSVTYGGVALTQSLTRTGAMNHNTVAIWYLIAPTVGTANVVVTLSGSIGAAAIATSLYNVDQIDPIGATYSNDGHDTSPDTIAAATGVRDAVLDVIAVEVPGVSITVGSSQTQEMNIKTGANNGSDVIGGASIQTGAAAVTMSWTQNTPQDWSMAAVSIRQALVASPVTQDAVSSSSGTGVTSLTWSHTVAAGSNRYMLVRVALGSVTTVTSVTYSGSALTYLGRKQGSATTVELWGTTAPAVGTANVVVTVPSATGIVAGAVSAINVDQTSPTEPIVTASATSNAPSVTATADDGEIVYDIAAVVASATTITATAGQTQDFKVKSGVGATDVWGAASDEAGARSTTMAWTINTSTAWAQAAIGLRPASLVTVDATQTASTAGAASLTWSHTVAAGSNRYLLVRVALHGAATTLSTVTYGGTALSYIGRLHGTRDSVEMWGLLSPTAGTANVVVTPSSSTAMEAVSTSLTNVNQINPYEGFTTASGSSTAPSVTVSAAGEDLVFDVLAADPTTSSVTVGAGQTQGFNANTGVTATDVWGAGSREEGSSSTTMSWTLGTSKAWALASLGIRPATSVTAGRLAHGGVVRYGAEVVVEWQSPSEHDTLGYFVERDDGAGPRRLGSSLILAGSLARRGAASERHTLRDASAPQGATYWIEELSLDGTRHRHGPLRAAAVDVADDGQRTGAVFPSLLVPAAPPPALPPPPRTSHLVGRYGAPWPLLGAAPAPPDVAALPAVKLLVSAEGLYRIAQPALVAAGLDPTVDPRRLRLWAGGVEQAIRVSGEDDGRLDPTDAVEFYGLGLDTTATDTRAYWLVAGPDAGRRMPSLPLSGLPPNASSTFAATVERRDRVLYVAALHASGADNFFGPVVSNVVADQSLSVDDADPAARATLEVALQGAGAGPHAVSVSAGGALLGTVRYSDQQHAAASFPLPAGILVGATLSVTLHGASATDVSVVDTVRLTYARRYVAPTGALRFEAPGGARTTLTALPGPAARVFDVTDADSPVELEARVEPRDGAFAASFDVPGTGTRLLQVSSAAAWLAPTTAAAHRPVAWSRSQGVTADLLILAHHDFIAALAPLIAQRQSEGITAVALDVADVYDQVSGGEPSAAALRALLGAARTWPAPPRWVLLVGDASVDPRNFLGQGAFDFVPTRIIDTRALQTASDDWLADFDGDGAADLPVGRLPARTAADAARMVAKIVAHRPVPAAACGRALLVADEAGAFDFPAASLSVARDMQAGFDVQLLARGAPEVDSQAALPMLLAADTDVVNYYGHGSVEAWSGTLSSASAQALRSDARLPAVVAMTCLNGFFHDVYTRSLAESLLLAPTGGAVAVWASSSLADVTAQAPLDRAFLRLATTLPIGDAALAAKREVSDADIKATWILFGDPSMRLRAPAAAAAGLPRCAPPVLVSPAAPTPGCGLAATAPRSATSVPGALLLVALAVLARLRRKRASQRTAP